MRRVFFLYFLWVLCLTAPILGRAEKPWGALNDYVDHTHYRYAMDFLMFNPTIYYNTSDEITPEQEAMFVKNVQKWPQEVLRIIREQKLESKFKDITPILEKSVTLKKRANKPDIFLKLAEKHDCGQDWAAGCFSNDTNPFEIAVVRQHQADFNNIILHEIGHFYGLGDQYEGSRVNTHAEYSSDVNKEYGSVMQGGNHSEITCDDADGFINLIDIRRSKMNEGKFSKRAERGWVSLCPQSANFYQNGKTINRKIQDLLRHPTPGYAVLRTYHKGSAEGDGLLVRLPDRSLLFDTTEAQITRDPKTNLITAIKTPLEVMTANRLDKDVYVYDKTDGHVFWVRTFQYQPKQTENSGTIVPVVVTEYIDKVPKTPYEIKIYENGDLIKATHVKIANGSYTAKISETNRVLTFQLNKQTAQNFRVNQWDPENKQFDKLEGVPGEDAFQATVGGESFTCSLNDFNKNPCKQLANYYGSYQAHLRNLKSFYKNFYDPFFGDRPVDEKKVHQITADITRRVKKPASATRGAVQRNGKGRYATGASAGKPKAQGKRPSKPSAKGTQVSAQRRPKANGRTHKITTL